MNASRADARFLLPRHLRSAALLGSVEPWREPLEACGVDVTTADAELVVTDREELARAIALGPQAIVCEGRGAARPLRAAGYRVHRYLPLPGPAEASMFIPLDQARPAAYALDRWAVPPSRWKSVRNIAVRGLVSRGILPPVRPSVTVASRLPGPPFPISAAADLGVPSEVGWLLTPGRGDLLSRGLLSVFHPGRGGPTWALKYARVPGYGEAFDRDERGLAVGASDPVAARHAPRLLGRFDADGLQASLETAAVGRRLTAFLHSAAGRGSRLQAVERIAAWIVDLGSSSAGDADALRPERQRINDQVLPAWSEVPPGLVDRVPAVRPVLQHNDLGCWNLVVEGDDFTAVDWESARRWGFPLWDLWYFLADATGHLEGAEGPEARLGHFVRLFRGEQATSPLLWAWTRRATRVLGVPDAAVGPLATLCWLHHGRSHVARRQALDRFGSGAVSAVTTAGRMAELWLTEPGLGTDWEAWQARRTGS